jgi:hypothetical protein
VTGVLLCTLGHHVDISDSEDDDVNIGQGSSTAARPKKRKNLHLPRR